MISKLAWQGKVDKRGEKKDKEKQKERVIESIVERERRA